MENLLDLEEKIQNSSTFNFSLEEILRNGAKKLLQKAIENEVLEYMEMHKSLKDENGRQLVIRNGYLPKRSIQTGLGPLSIKQPRIRDKRENVSFTSAILPKYMRKTPSIEAVISTLYLKGISTGNFQEALEAILGKNAKGLSPANITRLKQDWEADYNKWKARDLSGKHYVYIWVDGIYFNVRLTKDRPCLLVIIGALPDGKKELVGIYDGHRESKLSWKEALIDLREKGMTISPSLAVGDGALGFWAALREVFPETQEQRCWVHKTANILDKMAKTVQVNAKSIIHEMYMSPTKAEAIKAMNSFIEIYKAKYPKACECLLKDKEELFTFYDFPAEHWQHIRTTNPIESTFATVRHRTRQTKGCGSRLATLTMVFKLVESAQKHWRRLRGYQCLVKVINRTQFKDGEEVNKMKLAV